MRAVAPVPVELSSTAIGDTDIAWSESGAVASTAHIIIPIAHRLASRFLLFVQSPITNPLSRQAFAPNDVLKSATRLWRAELNGKNQRHPPTAIRHRLCHIGYCLRLRRP